jgi:hypothetical protein
MPRPRVERFAVHERAGLAICPFFILQKAPPSARINSMLDLLLLVGMGSIVSGGGAGLWFLAFGFFVSAAAWA